MGWDGLGLIGWTRINRITWMTSIYRMTRINRMGRTRSNWDEWCFQLRFVSAQRFGSAIFNPMKLVLGALGWTRINRITGMTRMTRIYRMTRINRMGWTRSIWDEWCFQLRFVSAQRFGSAIFNPMKLVLGALG